MTERSNPMVETNRSGMRKEEVVAAKEIIIKCSAMLEHMHDAAFPMVVPVKPVEVFAPDGVDAEGSERALRMVVEWASEGALTVIPTKN